MTTTYSAQSLPDNDNIPDNPYAWSIELNPGRPWFMSKGAMIAFYGQVQFQGVRGSDVEQYRQAGRQVIVEPPEFVSGELRTPFERARR